MTKAKAVHKLKTWPPFYHYVESDEKTFEIRKDNRDYKVGDILVLQEFHNGTYTGRECEKEITFIISMFPIFKDYVGMSIRPVNGV